MTVTQYLMQQPWLAVWIACTLFGIAYHFFWMPMRYGGELTGATDAQRVVYFFVTIGGGIGWFYLGFKYSGWL